MKIVAVCGSPQRQLLFGAQYHCGGFGADKAAGHMGGGLTTLGYNVASSLELQASTKSTKETAL